MTSHGRPHNSAGSMYNDNDDTAMSKRDIFYNALSARHLNSFPVGLNYHNAEPRYTRRNPRPKSEHPQRWHTQLGMTVTPSTGYYNVKQHYNRVLQEHPEKREQYKQAWKNFRKHGLHVPHDQALLSRALQASPPHQHSQLRRQYREHHNRFARGTVLPPRKFQELIGPRDYTNTRKYRKKKRHWNAKVERAPHHERELYVQKRANALERSSRHYYAQKELGTQDPALMREHLVSLIKVMYHTLRDVKHTSLSIYIRGLLYTSIESATDETLKYIAKESSYADSILSTVKGVVQKTVQIVCPLSVPGGRLVNIFFAVGNFAMQRIITLKFREMYAEIVMSTEQRLVKALRAQMHLEPEMSHVKWLSQSIVRIAQSIKKHVPRFRACSALTRANMFFVDAMISEQLRHSMGIHIRGSMFRKAIEKHATTLAEILAGHTVDAKILEMLIDVCHGRDSNGHYLIANKDIVMLYQKLHPYIKHF